MKLTFFGATRSVTGSKCLLEHENKKILIDCGLFQGLKELRLRNWGQFPIPPDSIDAVILTHAHIDHSGYLPRLVKEGFKGPIYCTPATQDLCKILLPDTGFLQEEEARYANKKGFSKHHPAQPLFNIEDAYEALKYFHPVDYKTNYQLGEALHFVFRNAGHILGSANVTVTQDRTSICFSGDVGRRNDPILNPPEIVDHSDYLVMESTYGDRLHPKSEILDEIAEIINRTINRGGTLVVPAFAVGRTQTMLYYISLLKKSGKIPSIPIFLNSPMAINATNIYHDYQAQHKLTLRQCQDMCTVATYINSPEESIRLNANKEPKIIISASGMATGGRVLHHIKYFGSQAHNTILFTGFQAMGTRGDKLVKGGRSVKIHGEEVQIRAEVLNLLSLSAHADQEELVEWVNQMKKPPKKIFINHGEEDAALALREILVKRFHVECEVPQFLSKYNL